MRGTLRRTLVVVRRRLLRTRLLLFHETRTVRPLPPPDPPPGEPTPVETTPGEPASGEEGPREPPALTPPEPRTAPNRTRAPPMSASPTRSTTAPALVRAADVAGPRSRRPSPTSIHPCRHHHYPLSRGHSPRPHRHAALLLAEIPRPPTTCRWVLRPPPFHRPPRPDSGIPL